MSNIAFQIDEVSRKLGDAFCLSVHGLEIRRGEVLALIGPTGAGKTTLLRLLTGLEYPDRGVIQFDGAPLDRNTPMSQLRRITMVHQRPTLLAGSVEDNVAYGLRVRRRTLDSKVKEVLSHLQLNHLARRDCRMLSGGQIQLVALARSLVLEPQVLLLDEPTTNLDPAYVGLVESAIEKYQATRGATIVWATHNLFQAHRVSHRVTLMLDGSLVEVAENPAFFSDPADARTAAFIAGKIVY